MRYDYLAGVRPAISEALIVPLYDHDGTPLGTLWVAHHQPMARFGAEDVLVIERLAPVAAVALKRMQAAQRVLTSVDIPSCRSLRADDC